MIPARLWHDDVRPAPPGWLWARTNQEAIALFESYKIIECSLDHDLGYHDVELPDDPDQLAEVLFLRGEAEETGLDLCRWMVEHDVFPLVIRIHSWNPDGARAMAEYLAPHAPTGVLLTLAPFSENGLQEAQTKEVP